MRRKVFAVVLLLVASQARAEISWQEYEKLRAAAKDVFVARVTEVTTTDEGHDDLKVVVHFALRDVERTTTGKKPKDEMVLVYYTRKPGGPPVVGIGPVPVLVKDAVYRCFLTADQPAAYWRSFDRLDTPATVPATAPSPE